jgi:hypothetical protein
MNEQNENQDAKTFGAMRGKAPHANTLLRTSQDASEAFSFDLEDSNQAYLFGFLQADGHLYQNTRNRGKVAIEISAKDIDLLHEFSRLIPFYSSVRTRTRCTNFSGEQMSACWTVYDRRFRQSLLNLGFPAGKKSYIATVPNAKVSKVDYFRGLIDADGSLGMTANGFPFLALVTASEFLANAFAGFIFEVTGKSKRVARNARDKIYNITVFKEDAQSLAAKLYYDGCLALARKVLKAKDVMRWQRPMNMRRVLQKKTWLLSEDQFVMSHDLKESVAALSRTERSIRMRLWRLNREVTDGKVL